MATHLLNAILQAIEVSLHDLFHRNVILLHIKVSSGCSQAHGSVKKDSATCAAFLWLFIITRLFFLLLLLSFRNIFGLFWSLFGFDFDGVNALNLFNWLCFFSRVNLDSLYFCSVGFLNFRGRFRDLNLLSGYLSNRFCTFCCLLSSFWLSLDRFDCEILLRLGWLLRLLQFCWGRARLRGGSWWGC